MSQRCFERTQMKRSTTTTRATRSRDRLAPCPAHSNMSRHSKNASSKLYHSRHEKSKAGYGTKQVRLESESQNRFGFCPLSHQYIMSPVASPSGHLYEKEAILKYLLEKGAELKIARRDALVREAAERRDVLSKANSEDTGQNRTVDAAARTTAANASSFWTPALANASAAAAVEGHDGTRSSAIPTRPPSPVTGRPLKRKHLIPCVL